VSALGYIRTLLWMCLLLVAPVLCGGAVADSYPDRPIHLVVPFDHAEEGPDKMVFGHSPEHARANECRFSGAACCSILLRTLAAPVETRPLPASHLHTPGLGSHHRDESAHQATFDL
jgi:hypothetical protein